MLLNGSNCFPDRKRIKDSIESPLMNLTDLLQEKLENRKCRRCNRRLTDPKSLEEGIGPICKQHDNHTIVIGWAELRMPATMQGQGDAQSISKIGFEYFHDWKLVELIKVIQSNGEWFAFMRDEYELFDPKCVGISSHGPIGDLFESDLPNGTEVKYELLHQDPEWISEEVEYRGPVDAWSSCKKELNIYG